VYPAITDATRDALDGVTVLGSGGGADAAALRTGRVPGVPRPGAEHHIWKIHKETTIAGRPLVAGCYTHVPVAHCAPDPQQRNGHLIAAAAGPPSTVKRWTLRRRGCGIPGVHLCPCLLWPARRRWWALIPLLSFGLLAPIPFAYVAVQLRQRRMWWGERLLQRGVLLWQPATVSAPAGGWGDAVFGGVVLALTAVGMLLPRV
jgi:hypothetical protein